VIRLAISVVIGLALLAGCSPSRPALTVHLRCDASAGGKLSITTVSNEKTFDVKTVCAAGKIELDRYQRDEPVRFKLDRGDAARQELNAPPIHSDPHGFYTVLKITNTPPFLASDNI
jgi:hypothetical protein